MVYVVALDGSSGRVVDAELLNIDELLDFPLTLPTPLSGQLPTPLVKLSGRGFPADYISIGSIDIVSERLKDTLLGHDPKIEFLTIQLYDRKGRPYRSEPYFFAHLLVEVDCIDRANSKLVVAEDGYVEDIIKLTLSDEAASAEPVFWLGNTSCLPRWFVCDNLANEIIHGGFTGIKFDTIDKAVGRSR